MSNLDRSIAFYSDIFGMEVLVLDAFEGEQYQRILRLPGVKGRVALLKGGNLQLELFEFSQPKPRASDPQRPVCDHGITHFCIEVDDLNAIYPRLVEAGVLFHCKPQKFFGAANATYGRDPDGNVFELLDLS